MNLTPAEGQRILELTMEHAPDGILALDTNGKICFANDAAARTLQTPAAVLVDQTIFGIAPDLNPALWRELWKEIRGQESFSFEFTLAAAPGRPLQVEMTAYRLQPEGRELACLFFRDIEERKRLQNLQQEFVSTASHELRTPMTIIREGVAQVLEGLRGEINESQHRSLTIALTGIDRLGRIIDELLDMSKIESGKIHLRLERLDLAALAREVGGAFQAQADERGLALRVTVPEGPVMVFGDHDRLIQVLTNLIGNAFKFTEKGRIDVAVSAHEADAELAVTDTGAGLSDADLERVFHKFEQLGPPAVTGEKGTGLGLSISRGIIELHKGRLWAESRGPGQGSRFVLRIPRQSGAELFRDQLAPLLHEVSRRGGTLSAMIFTLEGPRQDGPPEPAIAESLQKLETLLHQHAGRKPDRLVKGADTLYVALAGTVKREARRVADRVEKDFAAGPGPAGAAAPRLSVHVAGFPEETPDEDAFLAHVSSGGRR